MIHQSALMNWLSVMKRLLQRIQDETGMSCSADSPANNPAGKDINDEGHINKTPPGGNISEIRDPKKVGSWREELAINMIARTRNGFVRKRRSHRLAANNALESHVFHQPRHSAAGNIKVFAAKLVD